MRNRYSETNTRRVDGMTRDEVCHRYQRKVVLLARRVHERLSGESGVTLDELVSSGAMGLLEAFDRFEAARGIQFTTFAEYRIRGAMYDDLRKNDTFSRRRRDLAKEIDHARRTLRQRLNREPEAGELAEAMDMDMDQYWHANARVSPHRHVSLDQPVGDGDSEDRPLVERLVDEEQTGTDARITAREVRKALADAIAELPDRQRHCVQMYYGKDMSLAEISAVFDVSVSRISQILKVARTQLKKHLEPALAPGDLVLGG